jgi:hypothetical protein
MESKMTKSELQVIARIFLICITLYVLLETFLEVFSNLSAIIFSQPSKTPDSFSQSSDTITSYVVISAICYVVLAALVVYFLIHNSNSISAKIASSKIEDESQISWLYVAFRLICVCAGILFLFWSLPEVATILIRYFSSRQGQFYGIERLVEYIFMFVLGMYFAFGAPGFVRWQVKMTLKQCNKLTKEQISSD